MPPYYFDAERAHMSILDQQASELPNSPFAEMETAQRADEIVAREAENTRAGSRMIIIATIAASRYLNC
jgi:hypothetical protein